MNLNILELIKDGLQTRVSLDEQTVQEYAEAMRAGEKFPPVMVFEDKQGKRYLADGFHRVEAAIRAGKKVISATVKDGTFFDALRHALGCNSKHGRRTTNADKRRALSMAWEHRRELFGANDPTADWLAEVCGVSSRTAEIFYSQMSANCGDLTPTRQAENGRTYKLPRRQMSANCGDLSPTRQAKNTTEASNKTRKKHEHLVPTDIYDVEIPIEIQAAFDGSDLPKIATLISNARVALGQGLRDSVAEFAAVRQEALVNLNNAYEYVKAAIPHCVCRMCQGIGCQACHNRGWQTKDEYERNPKEFRHAT